MKPSTNQNLSLCLAAAGVLISQLPVRAVDFHVATAQELQNALTLAAANGADDNIYLTNGYYIGNFNYNSAEAGSLTLQGEPGTTNTDIAIDGAGTGRSMNLVSSANAAITVRGITFLRNCGSTANAGLRVGTGSAADVLVEDCRFISPTSTSGMGLELASGQNVTVRRCTIAGVNSGGGAGVSISSFPGNVTVQNSMVTTNSGNGLSVASGSILTITGNTFTGNSGCGASCTGTTISLTGNTFTSNSGGGASCSGTTISLTGNVFTGNSSSGGANCSGTTITLATNTFTSNSSVAYDVGGGAGCIGTTVTLTGNIFTGNSTYGEAWWGKYGHGGGACCAGTTVMITGNAFTSNSANVNGGGFSLSRTGSGGTVTLSNNTLTGNTAANSGGGAWCSGSSGPVTLFGNSFIGNSAGGNGGGAFCSGTVTITGNTIKQNTSSGNAGGLFADGGTVQLLNNLVVRNQQTSSSCKGGGVWVRASALDMINNTVFGNTAVGSGGGVAFQVDGVTEILHVYNNIIWGNSASGNGADVHLAGTGSRKEFMFNDAHGTYGVWDIAQNLLDVAPQFFDPVNGDYHIQGTSPCKDAGTNGAPSLPATDLDGGPRIANGTVDLGCYEFSTAATHPADTDTNFVLTAAEFSAYAAAWKAGQTWSNAPTVIPADYLTRAGYLMTNGGAYHNDGSARPVNWKTGP